MGHVSLWDPTFTTLPALWLPERADAKLSIARLCLLVSLIEHEQFLLDSIPLRKRLPHELKLY